MNETPTTASAQSEPYHLFIAHRRHDHERAEDFSAWLRVERANAVVALRDRLRFDSYAQLHEYPRWNLFYKGLRLTRSALVTTWFRLKRGLSVPPGDTPATRRAEAWSGVEVFSYPSREEMVDALSSGVGADALSTLRSSHTGHTRRSAVTAAAVVSVTPDPLPPIEQVATLFFLRALPSQDREILQNHWGTDHRALVLSVKDALGYRAYDQNLARSNEHLELIAGKLGAGVSAPYDGVATLTYTSRLAFVARFFDPRTQIANFRLVADEVGFIDEKRSSMLLGRLISFD